MKTQLTKKLYALILIAIGMFSVILVNAQGNGNGNGNGSGLICNGNKVLICCTNKSGFGMTCKCVSLNQAQYGCPLRIANEQTGLELFSLSIFPNPVSGSPTISFFLEQSQVVSLNIFDISGRLISTVADQRFEEGEHELLWNAEDVNAGVYFLRVQTGEFLQTEKIIVTK